MRIIPQSPINHDPALRVRANVVSLQTRDRRRRQILGQAQVPDPLIEARDRRDELCAWLLAFVGWALIAVSVGLSIAQWVWG